VLQALEKNPRDRPADAAEFRRELFETAERLGLEGAAITSGPDLQALRGMGTESPSGRLVINLSRLRENRAATTSAGDLTVINEKSNAGNNGGSKPSLEPRSFPRVAVPLHSRRRISRAFLIVPIVLLGLIVGAIFFAVRLIDNNPASTSASPSPTASATPTPAATPERTQKRAAQEPAATPTPTNTNGKKGSKVGSFFKKAGRILKKPF
jgi:cell division septation protein DedD